MNMEKNICLKRVLKNRVLNKYAEEEWAEKFHWLVPGITIRWNRDALGCGPVLYTKVRWYFLVNYFQQFTTCLLDNQDWAISKHWKESKFWVLEINMPDKNLCKAPDTKSASEKHHAEIIAHEHWCWQTWTCLLEINAPCNLACIIRV